MDKLFRNSLSRKRHHHDKLLQPKVDNLPMQDIQKNWPGFVAAVKVADAGSFSEAARQLNITPAAVGKSIGLLETRLGVRLFNRTTRQLSLTPEGERVVERARAALEALDEAGAVAKPDADVSGLVRISCGAGYGRQFVLPVIARVLDDHPQLRVELSLSDQIVDLVKEGFDIGIRGGSEPPQGMVARRVSKVATVLVASPQYLQSHGTPRDWTDLIQHRRIGLRFASGRASQWNFKVGTKTHTFDEKPSLLVTAPEVVVDAALLHQGIAQMAQHHALEALRTGALVPLLKHQHVSRPFDISIFYPHRSGLAPRVRVVVDRLVTGLQAVQTTAVTNH
jgi:DNA-binding transcriptional LysR family regulator